jgi:hypothetical protein
MPMSRRSFLLAAAFLLILIGGTGGTLLWMLRYEQPWYAQAAVSPGKQRQDLSREFYKEFFDLLSSVNGDKEWGARFTDQQINSYFEEDFVQSGLNTRLLPEQVSHPRVVIEPDRLHLAFRYGSGNWTTLISIDFRVYLIKSETAVALELEGFRAGALPISAQSLLEQISESEMWQQNGMEVTWYRHPDNGHPVAVLRFQAYQQRNQIQLDALQLEKGAIAVRGKSNDLAAMSLRTMFMLPGLLGTEQ